MNAVRESHSFDPLFPFVFFYHLKGNPEQEPHLSHFHDWYEIVFVLDGQGTFFIDKEFYPMKKNDLFLIPGNVIHHANPSKRNPFLCHVILFHPALMQSPELGDFFSYLSPFSQKEFHYLLLAEHMKEHKEYLFRMHMELEKKEAGYRHALLTHLQGILLLIARQQPAVPETSGKLSKSELWMKEVLFYIDLHYTDHELTLPALAEQALVSPEHFSRIFRRVTGLTLPAYLGVKRLFKAKELLWHTDLSVAFISDACGYKSVSYFHSKFKEQLGCTPGEFRKKSAGPEV
ncbi:AraC family transcriptional regulator [Metabacillus sp. KIGAM252]|uniref:AraC family transcriptional regulator n=1 Tax=Metabacillus flavus TaxID=2823519 RepID=A0ABS5LH69_9BACI|nr:AraC family transcriptional regulator [Metabacillus flavus]MBS2970076.1 AraC family transcriptional regulator [Metabacillus flavus]